MRKVIVTNLVSIDGFIAGPGGNPLVLPMDESFDRSNLERLQAADTVLLGATSYTGFLGYWPSVADAPEPPADHPMARAFDDTNRAISRRWNEIDKVVVSDSITSEQTAPWTDTTTIVRRADAHAHVAKLKEQQGGEIVMFASHVLWNDLLRAGLVDELHLMVGPVFVGEGVRSFEGSFDGALRTVEVRKLDGSDNVLVRYEVQR
ncbi:MAG: dihydrofolate reductase family protein [Acidimicrobiales bacterium]